MHWIDAAHDTPALVFAAALALTLGSTACASLPEARSVRVESQTIAYSQAGAGPITVVFQSGLGDGMSVWAPVIERLGTSAAVFAYDRPGYGASPATEAPRDPCSIARELHGVLHAAGIEPPYVLVGHSLGGLYQYAFAKLYPAEVRALLLLDPTHPDHWATMQERAPRSASVLRGMRKSVFTDAMRAEFDGQSVCTDELRAKDGPLPAARLLVRSNFEIIELGAFEALVRDLEKKWLELPPKRHARRSPGRATTSRKIVLTRSPSRSSRSCGKVLPLVRDQRAARAATHGHSPPLDTRARPLLLAP